jgi:hypothetical protein
MKEPWKTTVAERQKPGWCGVINCRNHLGGHDTFKEEIRQIIEQRLIVKEINTEIPRSSTETTDP